MGLLVGAVVALLVGGVMAALAAPARHARRRGTAGRALAAAMASYDEGLHPTGHDAFVALASQEERGEDAPAPAPSHHAPDRGRDAGPRPPLP